MQVCKIITCHTRFHFSDNQLGPGNQVLIADIWVIMSSSHRGSARQTCNGNLPQAYAHLGDSLVTGTFQSRVWTTSKMTIGVFASSGHVASQTPPKAKSYKLLVRLQCSFKNQPAVIPDLKLFFSMSPSRGNSACFPCRKIIWCLMQLPMPPALLQ